MSVQFVNLFMISGAFLGGSYSSILLLIVSQFLCGFGAYSLIPLAYAILSDLCSDKYRQKGVVFVNSGWYIFINLGDFQP